MLFKKHLPLIPFLLISILTTLGARPCYADHGGATSGGEDIDTCKASKTVDPSKIVGSLADLRERYYQLESKSKNLDLLNATFVDPSFYNFMSEEAIRAGVLQYLKDTGKEDVIVARNSLDFQLVDADIPVLKTGYKPTLSARISTGCEKKQFALQYFPTHTVYSSKALSNGLSKVERVLFEVHEAYLAEYHPQIPNLVKLEKVVRSKVADIYTDYEKFNLALIEAHLHSVESNSESSVAALAWTGASFTEVQDQSKSTSSWQDPDGLTWTYAGTGSFESAKQTCAALSARLPSLSEWQKLSWYLGTLPLHGYKPTLGQALVLPHANWGTYWSTLGEAVSFSGVVLSDASGSDQINSVRCVK